MLTMLAMLGVQVCCGMADLQITALHSEGALN